MKRTLSLVLALIMVLGTFTGVFAAEAQETAVDVLEREGVLLGDNDGDLMLDKNLERREAVVLLSRLFDVESEAKSFDAEGYPTWADVSSDAYFVPFFAWAEVNKYFEGDDEGNFRPREDITAQDYSVVLLRALKYDVSGDAAWRTAYEDAKELGLLADVDAEEKEAILRSEMAVMTFNALGTKMNDSDETLAEFLGIEMPEAPVATELTADIVKETENLKEVVLKLSNADLVDADRLENVNNYKVIAADNSVLEIAKVDVVDNDVIVLLANDTNNSFLQNRDYTLRVRSINNKINGEYKFTAKDNSLPVIEEVVVLGKKGIKLVMSEPVDILDNVRGRSFVIDGKNVAMDVEAYGRNVILTSYYADNFPEGVNTLEVTGLTDFAGFRTERETFEIEMVEDKEGPVLVDLILRDNKTVEAVFDKDVYNRSLKAYNRNTNTGNISYLSGRTPVYANKVEKIDTNKVIYTFNDEFLRLRTDFTIEGVQNHSEVKMEATTMLVREILDNVEPEIISTKYDGDKKELTLYFDKEVNGDLNDAGTGFVVKNHFRLFEREVFNRNEVSAHIKGARYESIDRQDIIVVEFENLVTWSKSNQLNYILEIENFTDQNSLRNRMFRDYAYFDHGTSSAFAVSYVTAPVWDSASRSTSITIGFNSAIDRLIAEDFKNFLFTAKKDGKVYDVNDLKGRIVTEREGKELTIILPDFDVDDYTSFRILDTLKSRSGSRLNKTYTYDIQNKSLVSADYSVKETSAGNYEVKINNPTATFASRDKGNFKILAGKDNAGNDIVIKELTIDVPNGHVVIGDNIDKLVVKNISKNSIEILENKTVGTLVVATEDTFKVYGEIDGLVIQSDVDTAKVILATDEAKADKAKVTEVKKGDAKAVTVTGDVVRIDEANLAVSSVSASVYNNTQGKVRFVVKYGSKIASDIKKSDVKVVDADGKTLEIVEITAADITVGETVEAGYEVLVNGIKEKNAKDEEEFNTLVKQLRVEVKGVKSTFANVTEQ